VTDAGRDESKVQRESGGCRYPPEFCRKVLDLVASGRPVAEVAQLLGIRGLTRSHPWPTRAAARTAIFEWIEGWYNVHRLHSSVGYRSPADYETALAA
jgi:transposase InsO family protein